MNIKIAMIGVRRCFLEKRRRSLISIDSSSKMPVRWSLGNSDCVLFELRIYAGNY